MMGGIYVYEHVYTCASGHAHAITCMLRSEDHLRCQSLHFTLFEQMLATVYARLAGL